jgi:nucleoside-diphosphate-sugar epimerase
MLKPFEDKIAYEFGSVDNPTALFATIKKHNIDKIVHAATIVNPPLLQEQPMLAFRINAGGILYSLEAARIFDIKRIVAMSSIGVYTSKQYEPMDENHPILLSNEGPAVGAYGAAKIALEAFCWSHHKAHGTDFIALRPSAVYGLGMRHPIFIKPMVENSVRKEPTRLQTGREFPRDYTYVKDVALAIQLALEVDSSKLKDRIFLIATGKKLIKAGEIAEIIMKLIQGAEIEIGPGFSEAEKLELSLRGVISIERAKKQLGFKPQYNQIEGLKDYIAMYREYLNSKKS